MRTIGALLSIAAVACLAIALAAGCNDLSNGSFAGQPPPTFPAAVAPPKPKIEITFPARASFHAPGTVTVTGYTAPASAGSPAVSYVEVEGQHVPVAADGSFSTEVTLHPGLNAIRATAWDGAGDTGFTTAGVIAGQFRPVSQLVPEAIGLRLNDAGMSGIEKILEDSVATLDTTQLGTTPVLDEAWTVFRARATVSAVRFGAVNVDLDPQTDGFHVRADVHDPVIEIDAQVDLNGVPITRETVVLLADRISVATRAIPQVGVDERLEFTVAGTVVEFPNLRIQSGSPTINQIQSVLMNFAGRVIESLVGGAIDKLMQKPKHLEPMPVEIFGKRSIIDVRANRVTLDQGGMELLIKAGCDAVTPTAAGLAAPGSLMTPGAVPPLQTGYGLHIALDDDALNRIAFGIWASGAMVYDMDAQNRLNPPPPPQPTAPGQPAPIALTLTALELKQVIPEIGNLVPDSSPVNIVATAHLPPIFRTAVPPDVLTIEAGEVWIDIQVDRGFGWETILTVVAHLSISANITLDATGIKLSSSATPRFLVDVVDMPLVSINQRRIEIALALLLTPGVPYFLNQAQFPIVELQGLTVVGASAYADGASGDYLSVIGNLSR